MIEDALPVLDLRQHARCGQSAAGHLEAQTQLGSRRRAETEPLFRDQRNVGIDMGWCRYCR
jgi:hypothetical protein